MEKAFVQKENLFTLTGNANQSTGVYIQGEKYNANHGVFLQFPNDTEKVYNVSWDNTWKLVWPRVDELQLELVSGQGSDGTSTDKQGDGSSNSEAFSLKTNWVLEKQDLFRVTICAYDAAYTSVCESRLEKSPEFPIARSGLYSVQVDVVEQLVSFNKIQFSEAYYVVKATGSYVMSNMAQKPVSPREEYHPRVELGEANESCQLVSIERGHTSQMQFMGPGGTFPLEIAGDVCLLPGQRVKVTDDGTLLEAKSTPIQFCFTIGFTDKWNSVKQQGTFEGSLEQAYRHNVSTFAETPSVKRPFVDVCNGTVSFRTQRLSVADYSNIITIFGLDYERNIPFVFKETEKRFLTLREVVCAGKQQITVQFSEQQVVIELGQFLDSDLGEICSDNHAVKINGNEVNFEQIGGNVSNQIEISSTAGVHVGDVTCENVALSGKSGKCDGTAFSPENGATIEIAGRTMQYYFTTENTTAKARLFSQPLYGWQVALLFIVTFCPLGFGLSVHIFNMVYKTRMIQDLKKEGWNVYLSLYFLHNSKEEVQSFTQIISEADPQ